MRPIRKSLTAKDTMNIFVGVMSCLLLTTPAIKQELIKMPVIAVEIFIDNKKQIAGVVTGPTAGRFKQSMILICCLFF